MDKLIYWRRRVGEAAWRKGYLRGRPAPGLVEIESFASVSSVVVSEDEVEIKEACEEET